MKRTLLALALLAVPVLHADENPHRYIVVTRSMTRLALPRILRDDLTPRSDRDINGWDLINGFAADLTDSEVAQLRRSPHVAYVEPVLERHLMSLPSKTTPLSDKVTGGQETTPYGVSMVEAPYVWPASTGSAKTTGTPTHVAFIDTGIDYHDPELTHAFKGGIDLVNGDNDPLDDEGHGTHVAGIIAASRNSTGVVGVAPDADIYSVKVLNYCGTTTTNDVLITAIQWVVNKKLEIGGNWVVNMSLGGGGSSPSEQAAFQAAADAGVLVFAASGNGYDPTNPTFDVSYPAAYPSIVAVGAIDSTGTVADFSQRGPQLKLVAPGVDVLSTYITEGLSTSDGHSYLAQAPAASTGTTANPKTLCLSPPTINGTFVFCGFGGSAADFPPSVAGKIALISRGTPNAAPINFATKMANAKAAGAKAAVVYNNQGDGLVTMDLGIVTNAAAVLPMVFIGQSDGEAIKGTPNVTLNTTFGLEGYANLNGTSMATPHAAAVAALVWSVAPSASRQTILSALLNTAHDLGDPGFDQTYGYGLVNAYGAALSLSPSAFGFGPPPSGATGRAVHRRGH
jgi:serine protease